jgi:hypothetical protein
MKKLIFCSSIYLSWVTIGFGQTKYHPDKDTSKYKKPVIYVLHISEQQPIVTYCYAGINVLHMDSVSVSKPLQSIKLYGHPAHIGAIIFNLKKNTFFINLDELLAAYKIDAVNNSLPVYINNVVVFHPKETYFEPTFITSVKVSIEQETNMKYIDIKTLNETAAFKKN